MAQRKRVAGALSLNADRLCERLQQDDKKFAWVKRRLTLEEEQAVRALNLPSAAWGFRDEYVRRYPQGRSRHTSSVCATSTETAAAAWSSRWRVCFAGSRGVERCTATRGVG